ncbi:MAG: hypothetical protein WAL63_15925 [Solirubrobacteraceae bacterium]
MIVAGAVTASGNRPHLEVGLVLRRSWEVWHRSWGLFVGAAAIVQIPVSLAALAAAWVTQVDIRSTRSWQYVVVAAAVAVWATLGHHVVLAIAERIEAGKIAGRPPREERLLRDLPWRRLVLADVLVLAAITAGIVAFVVPGVVLAVLLAPAFVLLAMERGPVLSTLRRSCQLVRRDFAATALLIGGAWALTQIAGVALATVAEVVHKGAIVEVASQFAVNIVLGSLGAVVVVITTFALVHAASPGTSDEANATVGAPGGAVIPPFPVRSMSLAAPG